VALELAAPGIPPMRSTRVHAYRRTSSVKRYWKGTWPWPTRQPRPARSNASTAAGATSPVSRTKVSASPSSSVGLS